ncbi:MAG TPA: SRPBCC domain-containing protein [Rhizomicrobium sp.]|nr:SRPBCC domain-containing protein [Rhizomicrobium sp.]
MTSLTIVRRIKARPSLVFAAMTTAEGIAHWWGPDDGPVIVAQSDPRVGGHFRVRFRMLDGSEHESHGTFLEVIPDRRFSMTWRWAGGVEDPGESRIDVVLRAISEGTEVTFTHSLLDNDENRRTHEEGWTGSFRKLERYFAGS